MFDDKTVLILGAGASRPYGFPTSSELRRLILGQPVEVVGVFEELGHGDPGRLASEQQSGLVSLSSDDTRLLEHFKSLFRDSQRVSIDSFISGRSGARDADVLLSIARQAISSTILRCESSARLDGDWYQWLLEFLLRNGPDFPSDILSVVTFNYDRSLEVYLLRAFENAFARSPREAADMLDRIEFVHVYGSVGPLAGEGHRLVPYGGLDMRFIGADHVGLVTPRSAPETQERVRKLIAEAARLIFLGFGFWKENLDVLHAPGENDLWHSKKVFASCYKLWRSTQIEVDARLGYRAGRTDPLINWGKPDQDVFNFVTHYNLKAIA
jgi:hypothetical protein